MSDKDKENRKNQTTIRLDKICVVKMHILDIEEKVLNKYINRLIREDILRNGSEYIIQKYFKETKI